MKLVVGFTGMTNPVPFVTSQSVAQIEELLADGCAQDKPTITLHGEDDHTLIVCPSKVAYIRMQPERPTKVGFTFN